MAGLDGLLTILTMTPSAIASTTNTSPDTADPAVLKRRLASKLASGKSQTYCTAVHAVVSSLSSSPMPHSYIADIPLCSALEAGSLHTLLCASIAEQGERKRGGEERREGERRIGLL